MMTIAIANSADARLTKDSIASDSRPTESVTHQARVFTAIVTIATATESLSKLLTCACGIGQRLSVTRANLRLPTWTT
jgi:hypothetical protein